MYRERYMNQFLQNLPDWAKERDPYTLMRASMLSPKRRNTWVARGNVRALHKSRRAQLLDEATKPMRMRQQFLQSQMPLGEREKLALTFGQQDKLAMLGIAGRAQAAELARSQAVEDRELGYRRSVFGDVTKREQQLSDWERDRAAAVEDWRTKQEETPPTLSQQEAAFIGTEEIGSPGWFQKRELLKPAMSEQAKLQIASQLRKEFNAAKAYKDYETIYRSERAMKAALDSSLSADSQTRIASDQALAVLFQKMLDPTSVVRESEYARSAEGAPLLNRIASYIPRLQEGGLAIADEDRRALYEMAQKFLDEAKITFSQHVDRYRRLAGSYGVEPNLIFGNIPWQQENPVSPDNIIDWLARNGQ